MSDISQSFRQVFISQKNSGYLFELIITKVLQANPHFRKYIINFIDVYKSNIIDLQSFIFEDAFKNIYNEMKKSGPIELEEILILLNKITVIKFESMIVGDLNHKYQEDMQQSQQERTQHSQQQPSQVLETHQQQPPQPSQVLETYQQQPSQVLETHQQQPPQPLQPSQVLEIEPQPQHPSQVLEIEQQQQTPPRHQYKDLEVQQNNLSGVNEQGTCFHHLFSRHAVFENGKYHYRLDIKNVESINLDNIKILCNMYNINEYNNKMYLIEQNNKILITIPVGYYSIDQLLIVISTLFNNSSINKNKDYRFYANLNTIKNKIYLGCELNEREKFKRNVIFGISFSYDKYPKSNKCVCSLQEILGFEKAEYINNTTYVSENPPNTNIFQGLYVKLFLNNIELKKFNTSDEHFGYYECLDVNMEDNFGKTIQFPQDYNPYDIYNDNFHVETLSLQFCGNNMNVINTPIVFNSIFSFEYTM